MNWQYIHSVLPQFFSATLTTLKISIISIILAIIVGLICSILITYRVRVLNRIAQFYIELSQNTPLLIQLFFLYYGLPKTRYQNRWFHLRCDRTDFLGGSYMASFPSRFAIWPKGRLTLQKVLVYNRFKFLDMSFSLKRLPFQFRQ
ncbi:ABC transporter permease subunit [Acinetobacter baumannii]